MKYALCLRGISYLENFPYNYSVSPYTIDFSESLPFFQSHIINPLREQKHTVDIFINTYDSIKVATYIDILKPVDTKIMNYVYASPGTPNSVFNGVINLLEMVDRYTSDVYDFVIISRFDMIFLEKITDCFIPLDALTVVTPEDDSFFIISGNYLKRTMDHFIDLRNNNISNHQFAHSFLRKGNRVHLMYNHVNVIGKAPFMRCSREIFTPANHELHMCSYEDIFDKDHRCYGYAYKQSKEYLDLSKLDR
jgi:hypothetical protein